MFLSLNQYCNFKNITLFLIVFICCLNFSQGLVVGAANNFSSEVVELDAKNSVTELIKYLVQWAFRLAGLFAFIMIIYAGFQYLTAGGNVEQQKEAQERIFNTFIGIVLLFSFWLILNQINPNILQTPEPKPSTARPPVETEQLPVTVGNFVLIGAGSGKYSNIPLSWEFPNGAYIEESVAESLLNLANSNAPKGWQVTEACVSIIGNECVTTVHHVSNCHKIGTCVDVGFGGDPGISTRAAFIKAANTSGFDVIDEYSAAGSQYGSGFHLEINMPNCKTGGAFFCS